MKVKNLIAILEQLNPDLEVILQRDAEGNGYSPLWNHWVGAYEADSAWCGEAYLSELTEEDKEQGYTELDVRRPDGEAVKAALILVPAN